MSTPYFVGGPMAPPIPPMGLGPPVDPSMNNQPLQFNNSKGKPVVVEGNPGVADPRENMDRTMIKEADLSKPDMAGPGGPGMPGPGPGPMGEGGPMGPPPMGSWGPMMGPMPPLGDPMVMNMGFSQYPSGYMGGPMPIGPDGSPLLPPKEVITLKSAVLYPPPPNAPLPSLRERPPGCRTIFVGGLPENITEDLLREIFENCGSITSIRVSKKNFAHIRFDFEESVEKGIFLSGYRIKIENQDDKLNTGRLHVDYAQARDDLYEWECKQRAYAREERHRVRHEVESLRPPSPPPVTHYSDHEASLLMEQLRSDEGFVKASQILTTWLDRGDCSRRSANNFYSMIQSTNAHVRRLMSEKSQCDAELEQMKLKFRQRMEAILRQFEQIEKVFSVASKQKAWDHFSKAQRKNIDTWRKQAQEIAMSQQEDFLKDRDEAEMEMSDSEDGSCEPPTAKKKREVSAEGSVSAQDWAAMSQLRMENEGLHMQLEAYKNEVELLKSEVEGHGADQGKELRALQMALQGMQQQLMSAKQEIKTGEEEIRVLKKQAVASADKHASTSETSSHNAGNREEETGVTSSVQPLDERDARLIGLLSTFLHVHPFGASVDYILAYLHRLNIKTRSSALEDLMEKYPNLFRLDLHGVGVALERRWKFVGFDS